MKADSPEITTVRWPWQHCGDLLRESSIERKSDRPHNMTSDSEQGPRLPGSSSWWRLRYVPTPRVQPDYPELLVAP
eukprot:4397409-Amphidinium_carterae.1